MINIKTPLSIKFFPEISSTHLPPLLTPKNPPYRGGYGRGIRGTPPVMGI